MSSDDGQTCPSCGAYAPADADRCELCGTALEDSPDPAAGPEASEPDAGTPDAGTPDAGTPDAGEPEAAEPDARQEAAGSGASDGGASDASSGVYCNQCGWQNPAGARYCSQCGEALQTEAASENASEAPDGTRRVAADLPGSPEDTGGESGPGSGGGEPGDADQGDAGPEEVQDTDAAMGSQIGTLVGVSIEIVIGLFFVTLWSQSQDWGGGQENAGAGSAGPASGMTGGGPAGNGPGGAGPSGMGSGSSGQAGGSAPSTADLRALAGSDSTEIPSGIASQVDSLRGRMETAGSDERARLTRELVNLLVGAGRVGEAAVAQRDLAAGEDDVEQWRRAADLLYRWLQQMQQNGERRSAFTVARSAAEAYERVVEENPDDLEARTRMGESYLRTNSPMKGIRAINGVLEDDSTFVPARFQKGLALLQINRLDGAIEEFRKVQQFAGDGSAYSRQAERAISIIEERRGQGGSAGGSSGPSGASGPSR